jgi:chromosome segregation ATPase
VSDKELQRSLVEKIARLQATLLQQKAEEARHVEVDRESLARLLETARITRSLAVAPDSQTGIGRQLEALTIAQQTLIEQLQNLAAQQDKLSTMQRQLSDQIEIIRRELERTTRAIARPPAAAPAPATAPPPK